MKKICFMLSIALCLIFSSCGNKQGESKEERMTSEFKTMTIKPSDAELTESFPATIRGRQDVDIYPQVEGKIVRQCVKEGQHVHKGQTLFIIDQVSYRASLQTASAAERAAKAQVATARLELSGKQYLYSKKVVSIYDLQSAKNALEVARANYVQAKAQRMNASNSLSYTEVKSPANGVVGTLPFRIGTLVSSIMQKPLTTISDNAEMYVYFSMNESQLRGLIRRYGSLDKTVASTPDISLMLNDGSKYEHQGHIESISGVIDSQTGTASVRGVFANPQKMLFSGSIGNVLLSSHKKNAIIVSQSAIYQIQDKSFAYRVINRKAVLTPVKIQDMNDGKHYIILNGLHTGDVIIKNGVGNVKDGMEL